MDKKMKKNLPDLDFLEPHEKEELLRLLQDKKKRFAWLRKTLNRGPLKWFWPLMGWASLVQPLAMFAWWLGDPSQWLRTSLLVFVICIILLFLAVGYVYLALEVDK